MTRDQKPQAVNIHPLRIADARRAIRHVFIRDLAIDAEIGVHRHEKGRRQPVRINLDLTVSEGGVPLGDRLDRVVDYERVASGVRALIAEGHVKLVETLAERIAALCLRDTRVLAVRVRIEKLQAIADAASVGVEIERMAERGPEA